MTDTEVDLQLSAPTSKEFDQILGEANLLSVPNGLKFDADGISATMPHSSMTKEDKIRYMRTKYKISDDFTRYRVKSQQELDAFLLEEWQGEEEIIGVGGVGITMRSYEEIIQEYPRLKDQLQDIHQRVIVLGNGFSSLPLDLIEQNPDIEKITVVDIFDTQTAIDQLINIEDRLNQHGKSMPPLLRQARENLERMQNSDKIEMRKAFVGRDSLKDIYASFDYVINIKGPQNVGNIERDLLAYNGILISA